MNKITISLIAIYFVMAFSVFAQDQDSISLTTDTKPVIVLNGDKRNKDFKNSLAQSADGEAMVSLSLKKNNSKKTKKSKNKEPKGFYYGLETKRIFKKYEEGRKTIVETYHYLKDFRKPDPLVDVYYVFDIKTEKIKTLPRINAEDHLVLHGPYEKKVNGKVVEKGIYYAGTKHGRWEKYHSSGVLTDKEIYYRGFPKGTKFIYYDDAKTKIKEIVPMTSNYRHGHYISFYESGAIKEEGNYQYGRRVKTWMSYYDAKRPKEKGQRYMETKYPDSPFDKTTQPFVNRKWDEKGKYLIDNRG